jgi:formate transporter
MARSAELFTGNSLLVMAWCARKVGARAVLRSWGIVYLGSFVGALGTALLCFATGQYAAARGSVGAAALAIASAKLQHTFVELVALGVLCNASSSALCHDGKRPRKASSSGT